MRGSGGRGTIGRRWLGWLVVVGSLTAARGDGGHVVLQSTAGSYAVTMFAAPAPLVAGKCELSLLVQDRLTGEVIREAAATATLRREASTPQVLRLEHGAATNPLLLAATVELAGAGEYGLTVAVRSPGRAPASASGRLAVAANHERRGTLLAWLALPTAMILLFLTNQWAKAQAGRKGGLA